LKLSRVSYRDPKLLLIAPTVLLLLVLTIFPLIFSLYLAFCKWELSGGKYAVTTPVFIGLENFLKLASDERFFDTLVNTVVFVGGSVTSELIIGLGLALLLSREIRGRKYLRVMFLLPMMMTPVAVGYTWRMLYHPTNGPLNYLLTLAGIMNYPVNWMGDTKIALFSMILIDVWEWTPFMFLVFLAGLQALPIDPYESARMDGASRWQIFRYITLSALSPIIAVAVLLRSVEAFKIFDIIYVTTAGGPGTATEPVTMYVQILALRELSLGYASAVAYALLAMVIFLAVLFIAKMRKERI